MVFGAFVGGDFGLFGGHGDGTGEERLLLQPFGRLLGQSRL